MEPTICSITCSASPQRIDRLLTAEFPRHSRNYFQQLIFDEHVLLNGSIIKKSSAIVKPGDTLQITFPAVRPLGALPLPEEDMGVRILYEHADFLIVYKPAHVLVHAPNNYSATVSLVDWLVHSFKELEAVGSTDRPGIVHRLDKDTSGILIIPRNNSSHAYFSGLFQQRKIHKTYLAVVQGHPSQSGTMDFNISRHPVHKHKMTHNAGGGRDALTHYNVVEYFPNGALLEVNPVTGRTHQIRVHCAAIGHPIEGDSIYGTSSESIARQALHAYRLSFTYQDRYYCFWYDMPDDMKNLIQRSRL